MGGERGKSFKIFPKRNQYFYIQVKLRELILLKISRAWPSESISWQTIGTVFVCMQ